LLIKRDANQARSGRGQEHEAKAEANSHEAEAKIALIFSAKFYILVLFSKKTKCSVDF